MVYAKPPFAGPEAVLAYLSRYTHRVAISNRRLITGDKHSVTFQYKDYRAKHGKRHKTMQLATDEFIRRFLIHVLPSGFHRIRHFGLFANHQRANNLRHIRALLGETAHNIETNTPPPQADETPHCTFLCTTCGTPMIVIEIIERAHRPRAPPP